MTHVELNKMCNDFDKQYSEPFSNQMEIGRIHCDILTMRINLEIASQLAYLNEQGISLQGIQQRGDSLCVSVEYNRA